MSAANERDAMIPTRRPRLIAALLCSLAWSVPAPAQTTVPPEPAPRDIEEGTGLLRDGARLLFRGLMGEVEPALRNFGTAIGEMEPMLRDLAAMMGDLTLYQAPVILPNGDILIRRKPDAPTVPDAPGPGETDI